MLFTNTDVHHRTWNQLVNADTGATLGLAPGESAPVKCWREVDGVFEVVDLPADFFDLHLKPAKPRPVKGAIASTEPATPAENEKE